MIQPVGGLGNQMFQYAAARCVALRNEAELSLDLSWFETAHDRQFALLPFRIQASTYVEKADGAGRPAWLRRMVRRMVRHRATMPIYREPHFHFSQDVLQLKSPIRMTGYFQSEKYFLDHANVIRREFSLAKPPAPATAAILDLIENSDAICLHVRRGDYVSDKRTSAYHGVCSLDYYAKGLGIVSEMLQKPRCFVFSDDPDWARKNLRTGFPTEIVDIHSTADAHEDLRLMMACKRFVIANSSLSWWAAWLGSAAEKRVVAPLEWFASSKNETRDLVPADWIRI